jgi:hypothetical protein
VRKSWGKRLRAELVRQLLRAPDLDVRRPLVPHQVVIDLAADYEIDLESQWAKIQAAAVERPEWDDFLELHDRGGLAALAAEWGLYVEENQPKKAILAKIRGAAKVFPMPADLAPPRKRGGKAKGNGGTKRGKSKGDLGPEECTLVDTAKRSWRAAGKPRGRLVS